MSKEYSIVTKTVEEKVIKRVICDWCGSDIEPLYGFETREFELRSSKGEAYPEDRFGDGWTVEDMCDDCVDKLKSVLVAAGIKIKEYDY